MKILVIILTVLLVIMITAIIYLLISPVRIVIDSQNKILQLKWSKFMNAAIAEEDKDLCVVVSVPFWHRKFSIVSLLQGKKKKEEARLSESKFKKPKMDFKKIRGILRQIKVKEFKLLLDTSDVIRNAYLVPIFQFVRYRTGWNAYINFLGRNELKLKAESRMINLLIAGIF